MTAHETVIRCLTGNGLVMELTEIPGGKEPWWWVGDERRASKALSQTYRHRTLLKAYGCRWSKRRAKWYYIGADLPEEIAALVGPQDTVDDGVIPTAGHVLRAPDRVLQTEQSRLADVLHRFSASFEADLARLTNTLALPEIATVRLDDPWA